MSKNYSPTSYYFVDPGMLSDAVPGNKIADSYGPVNPSSEIATTTQFRTTSFVNASGLTKVFAICKGQVLIQPNADDFNKVNLILKPDTNTYAPLKIKYFIYRGINKADLIFNFDLKPQNITDQTQPVFLQTLWDIFTLFNAPFHSQSGPPANFPAKKIGYDPENQDGNSSIDSYFYRNADTGSIYQIPPCEAGDHIGNFSGKLGLDIVLDQGNYTYVNESEIFQFDLNFARAKENILDLSKVTDSSVAGVKRYQEYVNQFMDIAAFWGSHISCGKINMYNSSPSSVSTYDKINDLILKKFQTQNNVYVYILGENDRSYNYYNSNRTISGFKTPPEKNNTNGWPILIKKTPLVPPPSNAHTVSISITLQYSIDNRIDSSSRYVFIDLIAPNNLLDSYPLSQNITALATVTPPSTTSVGDIAPISVTLETNGANFCASFIFIYANLTQYFPLANYYDFMWTANLVSNLRLPQASEKLSYWATYDKNRLLNLQAIAGCSASIQNKIIFDTGKNTAGAIKERRLFIGIIKRNTSHDIESDKLNIKTFTAGISKNQDTVEKFITDLYYDKNFSVLKGEFTDNSRVISSLSLFNSNDLNARNSYFQLGITNEEYNKLMYDSPTVPQGNSGNVTQILPSDAANVSIALSPIAFPSSDSNIKKFQVGLNYEDNSATIQTTLGFTVQNPVYVYTLDGYYFFSEDFANYQVFYDTYPKCKIQFRPQSSFTGEYGFDWMRIGDTSLKGDDPYIDLVGKLYTDSNFQNVETDINHFNIDPNQASSIGHLDYFNKIQALFKKLEIEYKPTFIQSDNQKLFEKYYSPILSIYPPYVPVPNDLDRQPIFQQPYDDSVNRIAGLSLIIKVVEEPDKIELSFDTTLFAAVVGNIPKTSGTHTINITVRCLKEFGTVQLIKAVAYYRSVTTGQTIAKNVGTLRVKPNIKVVRRSKQILMISVRTSLNGSDNSPSASMNDKALYLKKLLRQAFITPIIKLYEIDVRTNSDFNNKYIYTDSNSIQFVVSQNKYQPITPTATVDDFLYDLLKNTVENGAIIGNKYDNFFKLFFFEENGGSIERRSDGHGGVIGVFFGLNGYSIKDHTVGFKSANSATATHEFLHSANLPHSFTASEATTLGEFAKYTYKPLATDNIMDYSHRVNINRITLWNWQAEIANAASDPEP